MLRSFTRQRAAAAALFVGLSIGCGGDPASEPELESGDAQATGQSDGGARDSGTRDSGDARDAAPEAAADASEPDGETSDAGEPDNDPSDGVFYRVQRFALRAPELVLGKGTPLELPVTADVQTIIDGAFVSDAEPADGYVDLSLLIHFVDTRDPAREAGGTTFGGGVCPYPYDAMKVCGPEVTIPFQAPAPEYENATNCQLDGASNVASGPCFKTTVSEFTLSLPLLGMIPLENGQVIGSWVESGEAGIANGRVRGFLSESTAQATTLPSELPELAVLLGILPGTPIATFFPDRQLSQNDDGEPGWWFDVEFGAEPARFDPSVGPDGVSN